MRQPTSGCFKPAENHPGWHGGMMIRQGRTYIRSIGHPFSSKYGGCYVARYRLIIEEFLSKEFGYKVYLDPKIAVHHINEDMQDDRIENLEITTFSSHIKKHKDRIRPPPIPEDRKCAICRVEESSIYSKRWGWRAQWKCINKEKNEYWCKDCWMQYYDKHIRRRRKRINNKWVYS